MDIRQTIIELVEKNDGKWTWYQLERGLTSVGLGGRVDFMDIVTSLVNEGLVSEQVDARYPHPLYRITEKGRASLKASR
ncbi:MAG: hypothetical protein HYU78_14140 [Rhodocyclales bacterium]|nr:hypothetical protein [Rhodocyclales bacterium]